MVGMRPMESRTFSVRTKTYIGFHKRTGQNIDETIQKGKGNKCGQDRT